MGSNRVLLSLIFIVVILFGLGGAFLVHSHGVAPQSAQMTDIIDIGLHADPMTDPHAFGSYHDAVRLLLEQRDYDRLEQLAASARDHKELFPGGGRKLSSFYITFAGPRQGDKATEEDWKAYLESLEDWKKSVRNPLTADIALAKAYTVYAWVARGEGFANTVSKEQWASYGERLSVAHKLLDEVADQRNRDPMWYDAMLELAVGENWDQDQEKALFEAAIANDPTYFDYYTHRARYLRPEWSGEDGDVRRFANEMYDRLGPINGPIVYFEIAAATICDCGGASENNRMSVAKIKEGYAQLDKQYRANLYQLNQLAFIAWQTQDPVQLETLLKRIGLNVTEGAWQNERSNYERAQQWLDSMKTPAEPFEAVRDELKTEDGQNYAGLIQADFDRKFGRLLADCRKNAGDDLRGFYFYFKQDATGKLSTAMAYPATALNACFGKAAMQERPTFIAPPHADYWNRIVIEDREVKNNPPLS